MTVPGLQRGALIKFCLSRKTVGVLIGAGALKGANMVTCHMSLDKNCSEEQIRSVIDDN